MHCPQQQPGHLNLLLNSQAGAKSFSSILDRTAKGRPHKAMGSSMNVQSCEAKVLQAWQAVRKL